jgi:hypothetical protein
MGFQPKTLKIWMVLNLIDVYQCHSPQKIEQKIPSITLVLKYICKISFTYEKYYFVTYTLHTFKLLRFCCFKKNWLI